MFIFRLIIALFVATNSQHTLHTSIHILIQQQQQQYYTILYQKSLELSTHKLIAHKVDKL